MARHWIFDLDGTLVNSHPLYRSVFENVVRNFQLHLPPSAWDELCRVVLPDFLERHFPTEIRQPVLEMVIEQNMARQSEIEVYPGIPEVLGCLREAGCVMSVCTARELKSATGLLRATKLDSYFDQLVSRDCVVQTKPHPEGINRLMNSTATTEHETIMVGDHRMDIEAARGAGIRAVSVCWNVESHDDLSAHSDHHFNCVTTFHHWAASTAGVG